mmetsp:Transcript_53353/g.122635  ORF Transcript_53353/g.122635 Transcript_53353/m.122635 type:complete len:238 (+) Transcript_53353:632-1345(+)
MPLARRRSLRSLSVWTDFFFFTAARHLLSMPPLLHTLRPSYAALSPLTGCADACAGMRSSSATANASVSGTLEWRRAFCLRHRPATSPTGTTRLSARWRCRALPRRRAHARRSSRGSSDAHAMRCSPPVAQLCCMRSPSMHSAKMRTIWTSMNRRTNSQRERSRSTLRRAVRSWHGAAYALISEPSLCLAMPIYCRSAALRWKEGPYLRFVMDACGTADRRRSLASEPAQPLRTRSL